VYITVILAVAAFATAVLSGIIGMGGGMLLLAVLLSFMPHSEAIPVHAAVQLASNGTRILAFLRHVDWRAFGRFCLGVVPGGAIGATALWMLGEPGASEPYWKMLVGAFILFVSLKPKAKKGGKTPSAWDFPLFGLLAGAAALTVGAVGPLIAPVFARQQMVKERLIATKAMCQMVTHIGKIPAFLLIRNLDPRSLGLVTLIMIAMVIPGTLLGKRLLRHVSEQHFVILYKVALTVAGLKVLLIDGLRPILFPA
jgi:uncharacterized membrane protein YfcA